MLIVPTRRHDDQGFTLIELMVGITIVGLLLTQALPSFTTWLRNLQIRNSAEAILNGLQLARAQAVRTNTSTELVLLAPGTDPVVANINAAADPNGTNWIVRRFQPTGVYNVICPPIADDDCDFVQGRVGQEGSTNAAVVAGPGSTTAAFPLGRPGSYVFTPLGRLLNPPPAPAISATITVDSADAFTGQRRMCIVVSTGGQALMCDPNGVDATNPQFCPGAC